MILALSLIIVALYLSLSFVTYGLVELAYNGKAPTWVHLLAAVLPIIIVLYLFTLAVMFYGYKLKRLVFQEK